MDKIIPLRIDESMATGLDALVARGLFRNRNEALRQGTRDMIERFQNNLHEKRVVASRIVANFLVSKYACLVTQVILFGSVARHEDTEWSDVDLMVLLRKRVDYTMEREIIFDIYSLIDGAGMVVSPHFQAEGAFHERARVPNSIEAAIVEEGLVLAKNESRTRHVRKKRRMNA